MIYSRASDFVRMEGGVLKAKKRSLDSQSRQFNATSAGLQRFTISIELTQFVFKIKQLVADSCLLKTKVNSHISKIVKSRSFEQNWVHHIYN